MIRFFCAGIPKSMSVGTSFRLKRNGVDTHIQGRRNTDWATLVGQIGREHAPSVPLDGPVRVSVAFHLPRPKTASRKVVWPIKRPDVDNLAHKLTDQFNGVFWVDDAQIVVFLVTKRFAAERPGVQITVEEETGTP